MSRKLVCLMPVVVALWASGGIKAQAQAVAVTATLDTNRLFVGEATTLRVWARVAPALEANADRIFSWYVDVLNTNGTAAGADFANLLKSASDNDPDVSSAGFDNGAHRRGIYDTFLDLPGAGVSNAVELMAVTVMATAAGETRFAVQAGTGVEHLSEDFIVAPLGGGPFLSGGDYSTAFADLRVLDPCQTQIQILRVGSGGPGEPLQLTFPPCVGFDHAVEFRGELAVGAWEALPGTPHNTGSVTVTNSVPSQFFRVRAVPQ